MKKIILALCLLCTVSVVSAQKKFTYNDIEKGLFASKGISGVRSMNSGQEYTAKVGNAIVRYSYQTGKAIDTLANTAGKLSFSGYDFSYDEKEILLTSDVESIYRRSFRAEYWIYNIATGELRQLSKNGKQQVASFSPDGTKVAFVRDNNLFYTDLKNGKETQITSDGKFNFILNGIPDWVYEEEYGFAKAYEWSPESDAIAFYRFDEERVKEYNMNRFDNKLYPTVYAFKYPKAGEDNSLVTIHSYDLNDGKITKLDVGTETNQYIPRIKWSAKKDKLVIFRLNRLQNKFEMLLSDAKSGASQVFYTESNPRYIERVNDGTVTFLPDGDRFIVKSEKDGFMHLYLYSIAKGELNQITKGPWEVTGFFGVDPKTETAYYMSTETSPLRRNMYAVKLNGKDKKRLTPLDGTYSIAFSKGLEYYISTFSNATTPTTITLHTKEGKLLRTLEDNAKLKAVVEEYKVPMKEFFTFKTSQGVELNGYMIRPNGFDAAKKYPVLMTQYSGPGSQTAADRWGLGWEDALVQDGYIVACIDGRGTGFRGEEFKKCTYRDLGKYEVIDQIEGAKYLGTLPYVDPARIGIYGWSYGGFMALNCILKGNDVFSTAVSVAPVTNWRYYDSIYTELYNGLPQDNPEGYDQNSPINFAEKLKGKLFLAHGTGDDNVHIQNSYEMVSALVGKGKNFEMFMYPDKNHGMGNFRSHINKNIIDFVKRSL